MHGLPNHCSGLHAAMAARQIVFVRHGLSKMNVALGRQPWAA